jgi:hypothetical protein
MKPRDVLAAALVVAAGVGIGLSVDLPQPAQDTPARQGARQAVLVGMGQRIPARDRLPESIRSVALVMPTPVADAAGFDAVWGAIYCEPLADAPTPDLYDACVAQQVGSLGPLLCLADGTPAGHVTRIQATPALAERAAGLVGEVPQTWVACPDPVTP